AQPDEGAVQRGEGGPEDEPGAAGGAGLTRPGAPADGQGIGANGRGPARQAPGDVSPLREVDGCHAAGGEAGGEGEHAGSLPAAGANASGDEQDERGFRVPEEERCRE